MPKLMTVRVTAPILNMAEITLRRAIRRKEIPYHRIGKRYFFTPEDIETYLLKTAVPIGGVKK